MKGYNYIANFFQAYGVTHYFYMEAMLRETQRELYNLGIRGILAHSENAAGYMADGYARASGRPGICMCQSIGAANLTGGIMDAYLAGSPVLALTGKKAPVFQYRHSYQEADHRLFYESITKFNAEVALPEQLGFLLRQSFRELTAGKPAPVHLDMIDRMGADIEVSEITEPLYAEARFSSVPAYRPAARKPDLEAAILEIDRAESPVLVVGRGAVFSEASEALRKLAVKADIPVVTTPDGKAQFDETDSLWCGIVGGYGMDCANRTVMNSDLVIFVGTHTSDQVTRTWTTPAPSSKVIQIDISPEESGRNYPNFLGLFGDAATVLAQLADGVREQRRPAWRARTGEWTRNTTQKQEERKQQRSGALIRPEVLCAEFNKALPDDAVVVADTGNSAIWSATMLRLRPGQKYLRAAGSLGWAFPAALGAKCAVQERPVICFTGDGAFYYHLGEVETAVRYNIPAVIVINNNQMFGQSSPDLIKVNQNQPDKGECRYRFTKVNLSQVAKDMGAWAVRVTDADEIAPAIRRALDAGRPAIVEVLTEGLVQPLPAFEAE